MVTFREHIRTWVSPRNILASLLPAVVAAGVMVLCDAIDGNGYFAFSHTVRHALLLTGGMTLLFLLLLAVAPYARLPQKEKRGGDSRDADKARWYSRHAVLVETGIIFLCWLPWLIALYPANFLGDTLISIGWFTGTVDGAGNFLSDHNPILTVALFGGLAELGKLLHHVGLVFFVFVLVQAVCTCYAFARAVQYAYTEFGLRKVARNLALGFYALCPLFPVWCTYLSKDALFSPLFVLWCVHFVELVRTSGRSMASSREAVVFSLLTIAACLTKKLGIYILLPSIFIALICCAISRGGSDAFEGNVAHDGGVACSGAHGEGKTSGTSRVPVMRNVIISFVASAAVLLVLVPHVLLPILHVQPTERYETYSVQLQQTARYVADHPDDITPEEWSAIDRLLDGSDLSTRWVWYISDPVKYRISEPTDAYSDWLKAYLAEGLRHPLSYVQSYVALESGFGKSDLQIAVQMDSSFMSAYDASDIPDAYMSTGWSLKTGEMAERIYTKLASLPIVGLAHRCVVYTLVIPGFYVAALLASRRKKAWMWLIAVPFALTELGLWISPISITVLGSRYFLPLLYCGPWLFLLSMAMYASGSPADGESYGDDAPSKSASQASLSAAEA